MSFCFVSFCFPSCSISWLLPLPPLLLNRQSFHVCYLKNVFLQAWIQLITETKCNPSHLCARLCIVLPFLFVIILRFDRLFRQTHQKQTKTTIVYHLFSLCTWLTICVTFFLLFLISYHLRVRFFSAFFPRWEFIVILLFSKYTECI